MSAISKSAGPVKIMFNKILLLTSSVQLSVAHTFSACPADMPGGGSTGLVPFTAITLTPDPPAAGSDLVVDFTTDPLKISLTGGHGLFHVKLHGIPIAEETFDMCSQLGITCPLSAGVGATGSIKYLLPSQKIPS